MPLPPNRPFRPLNWAPFTLHCLIERFAIFDATAGKLRHIRGAALGCEHDSVVIDGNHQRKYAAARLDD
jgi:hypothetical protein